MTKFGGRGGGAFSVLWKKKKKKLKRKENSERCMQIKRSTFRNFGRHCDRLAGILGDSGRPDVSFTLELS